MTNSASNTKAKTPADWRKLRQERRARASKVMAVLKQQDGRAIELYALQQLVDSK